MTDYIDRTLADNEEIIVRAGIAWPYHATSWLSLLFLGVFIIGIIIFIRLSIWIMTTKFVLTNRRVVYKRGWIRRRTQELSLTTIEEVELRQSVWGRLFGFGRLAVSGSGTSEIISPPIADPIAFRSALSNGRAALMEAATTT